VEAGTAPARAVAWAWVVLLAACTDADKGANREHPIVTGPRIVAQNGRNAVRLDDAALQRAGIRTEPVRRGGQPETVRAFATVPDLQPLAHLSASLQAAGAQLKSAQAKLDASRAEYERERRLFDDEQNVSAAHLQPSPRPRQRERGGGEGGYQFTGALRIGEFATLDRPSPAPAGEGRG